MIPGKAIEGSLGLTLLGTDRRGRGTIIERQTTIGATDAQC